MNANATRSTPPGGGGGHADSLRRLQEGYDGRYGKVTPDCLRCHAAEAAVDPGHERTLDEVEHGIGCAVCHQVHGDLDTPRLACNHCHEQGAFYHRPERNPDHVVCYDQAEVTCTDCHMPHTVWNGGGFNLPTHHPGIVPPADTARYGVPNSCANDQCHADKPTEWLQAAFERYYSIMPVTIR